MTKIAPDNQCLGLTKNNRQCGNNVEINKSNKLPRLTCHLHPEFETVLQDKYEIENHDIAYHKKFHSKYFKEEWDANLNNQGTPVSSMQELAKIWFLHAGAITVVATFASAISTYPFSYFKYATVSDHTTNAFQFGIYVLLACVILILILILIWFFRIIWRIIKQLRAVSYTHLTLPTICSL